MANGQNSSPQVGKHSVPSSAAIPLGMFVGGALALLIPLLGRPQSAVIAAFVLAAACVAATMVRRPPHGLMEPCDT